MIPIQAGKAVSNRDLLIQPDNELNGQPCDNISEKNPSYSELTALYWAWKNLKKLYPDVKYVGWSHYRRFFALDEKRLFIDRIYKSASEIQNYRVNSDRIINILEDGNIILVKKTYFAYPLDFQYSRWHSGIDYDVLKKVIHEKFPDYYSSFINFMECNNKMSLYCMFIMKYEDFEKYCEWLFAVLSEVEPLVPYQYYNAYQKRVFAFMAERLLNVYVLKNKMKAKYFNIYFYRENFKSTRRLKKFLSCINYFLITCKNNIIMFLIKLNANPLRRLLKKFPLKP